MKKAGPFGAMALVLLAACQLSDKTVSNESEEHGKMNVSIVASIGQQNQKRTVSIGDNESVFSFCEGDQIGVFPENGTACKWELGDDGNTWKPDTPMKWPVENVSQPVTFYAYSPYTGDVLDNEVVMPDLSGQTGKLADLGKYDFLVARCTTGYEAGAGEVRFTGKNAFNHVSSLIVFHVDGKSNWANVKVRNVSLKALGIATRAKYVFKNVEENSAIMALPSVAIVGELNLNVDQIVSENGMNIYAIINPLTSPFTLSLTYERDHVLYETKEKELNSPFLSNNMYTFSLTVQKGEIVITGTEITPWYPNEMEEISMEEVKKGDITEE